ncbi:MAG TPA: hypothetical protein VIF09_06790 [Polyangiaceae bacterium]|jgi:hypothetical protein
MVSRDPHPIPSQAPPAEGEEEGIDLDRIKEMVGFVLRAARRRPKLAGMVFTLVAALGVTAAIAMPRTYNSQTKLLAQPNLIVPALSNPGRAVPRDADNPTKNVSDQILRRDNLVALATELDLVNRFYSTRSPLLKAKDWALGGAKTDEDKLHGIVDTLEKRFTVNTIENNVVISVDWSDPEIAYELVMLVQKNFLSARYDSQVAMISDAIAVLQDHAKAEATEVDTALEGYKRLSEAAGPQPTPHGAPDSPQPRPVRRATAAQTAPGAPAAIDPELATQLEETRQRIRALEAERQRELESLRTQLSQARLTLTPQHPTVIGLQQKLDAESVPDPQLSELKSQERALMARMVPTATTGTALPPVMAPVAPATNAAPPPLPTLPPAMAGEDPQQQLAKAKLEASIRRYQEAVSRIDAASMELEIARTAFKYQYTVVTPAEVARKPKKPMSQIVGVGSVVAALLLAFLLAAAADLASGKIIEEWQIRRRLKLDVLGEITAMNDLPGAR